MIETPYLKHSRLPENSFFLNDRLARNQDILLTNIAPNEQITSPSMHGSNVHLVGGFNPFEKY